jgi:hypothetical protein
LLPSEKARQNRTNVQCSQAVNYPNVLTFSKPGASCFCGVAKHPAEDAGLRTREAARGCLYSLRLPVVCSLQVPDVPVFVTTSRPRSSSTVSAVSERMETWPPMRRAVADAAAKFWG